MRAIILGVVAAIACGVIAAIVLSRLQEPAYKAYATSSTRVGDPGYNLVGRNWTGDPPIPRNHS
jgi:hypothetical protein